MAALETLNKRGRKETSLKIFGKCFSLGATPLNIAKIVAVNRRERFDEGQPLGSGAYSEGLCRPQVRWRDRKPSMARDPVTRSLLGRVYEREPGASRMPPRGSLSSKKVRENDLM